MAKPNDFAERLARDKLDKVDGNQFSDERLLPPWRVAKILDCSESHLEKCRRRHLDGEPGQLPFIRIKRRILYRLGDVRQWINDHLVLGGRGDK